MDNFLRQTYTQRQQVLIVEFEYFIFWIKGPTLPSILMINNQPPRHLCINNQPPHHLSINNQPRPSEPRQPVSRPGRPCSPPAVSSPGGKQLWEFQFELRLFLASYKNFNWARIYHKDLRVIFNQTTKLSVFVSHYCLHILISPQATFWCYQTKPE